MKAKNDITRNGSGYYDSTALKAISKVDKNADMERLNKLLHGIFDLCEKSGFHVEGRIVLKDTKTGKIWR